MTTFASHHRCCLVLRPSKLVNNSDHWTLYHGTDNGPTLQSDPKADQQKEKPNKD